MIPELVLEKNTHESAIEELDWAAQALGLPDNVRSTLADPESVAEISVPVRMCSGHIEQFKGYSVRHNTSRGPAKGGIRYDRCITPAEVSALAARMTWNWALLDIPFGGGKGGVAVDLRTLPQREVERLTCSALEIAPASDPASDKPVACTCKGRSEATGRGVFCTVKAACEHLWIPIEAARVVVQGFGNVGAVAASLLSGAGASVTAVSDTRGAIFNANGLDIPKLVLHKRRSGSVVGFPGAEPITEYELLSLGCEVLIAAAAEHTIHLQNAPTLRAKVVAEAADGAVTPKADRVLEENGTFLIPDSLAKAGGSLLSYYEWVQSEQGLSWDEPEVYTQLEQAMHNTFQAAVMMSLERKVNLRRAAAMLGVSRVADAIVARGVEACGRWI